MERKEQCDRLDKRGIKFLLSNSSCGFIERRYRVYIVVKAGARREINAKADKRGKIDEVLVRNYEMDEKWQIL
ncbi:hypothetical protein LQZ18_18680 [Lachnospiraceae bacterium ZAX-1]